MAVKVTAAQTVPILDRALTILEHLRANPRGLGVSDIAHQLEFPKNSVYRILFTLAARDYVRRDEDSKRYMLSRKLFSMAYHGPDERSLMENALDVMRALRDAVKETVVLSVLSDDESLIIEQMPGLFSFRFVIDPGTRLSIHASSHGKVTLAYMRDEESEALLGRLKLTQYTKQTITKLVRMREELRRIRERGYALDLAEGGEGVRCVSAPILRQDGTVVAALTTTGPAFRMPDEQLDDMGRVVRTHADRISARLGHGLV
jgi:DNA-binding IclR family transcriptional regulator